MSILFAILMFSVLIFLHELGHFVTAKLSGVQVNEFSMFMGPALWKKQIGETLYAIRLIPMGGYCAMEGEDGESDNPRSFQNAAWWKRLIILVAGSAMNFLTGLVIYACLFLPAETLVQPAVAEFQDCCTFSETLQVGDIIKEIDGEKVYSNGDISTLLSLSNTGGVHDLVIERAGETLVFNGLDMAHTHTDENGTYRHYGFGFGVAYTPTLGQKVEYVWNYCLDNVRMVRLSLQMLLTGQVGLNEMSGPVGIVSQMSQIAEESETTGLALLNLLSVGAFIAINLAVMNLLPIPALDGGRAAALLLTVAIEKITRRKLNPRYEAYVHTVGLALLLGLMAIVMFKDIFVIVKG